MNTFSEPVSESFDREFNLEWLAIVRAEMDAEAMADPYGIVEVEPLDDDM